MLATIERVLRRRTRRVRGIRRLAAALAALITAAAWGQVTLDTAVARVETTLDQSGRARRQLVPAEQVVPGEELRYTIAFHNDGETVVDAGRIVITNPVPDGTVYVPGTAGGEGAQVEYSTDGETFTAREPAGPASAPAADSAPEGAAAGAASAGPGAANGQVQSLRWTYQEDLPPGATGEVYFHVRML